MLKSQFRETLLSLTNQAKEFLFHTIKITQNRGRGSIFLLGLQKQTFLHCSKPKKADKEQEQLESCMIWARPDFAYYLIRLVNSVNSV